MSNEQVRALRLKLQELHGTGSWSEDAKHGLFTTVWNQCVTSGKMDPKSVPAKYAELAKRGEAAFRLRPGFASNMPK